MSSTLWVDASRGIAGDMLLGALIDAGAPLPSLLEAVERLALHCGESIGFETEPVRRHGLRATKVQFSASASSTHRGLSQVLDAVAAVQLDPTAAAFATAVFTLLAEAEAWVHRTPIEEVHFHEIGAIDSLADVVCCAIALQMLGLLQPGVTRIVSDVALGGGTIRTDHGVIPVPVPASLRLLAEVGAPITSGGADRELCTPTGAALVAALATGWGAIPAMTLRAAGSGAGSWDPSDRANITRVVFGETAQNTQSWVKDSLKLIETTIDDMDPRLWPEILEKVHTAGASDVWLTPILMRHGRPGHVLTALADPDVLESVLRVIARETTTLGVRLLPVDRRSLHRDAISVLVAGHAVSVKRGFLDGVVITRQPEYSDLVDVAAATNMPMHEVLSLATLLARDR